MNSILDEKLKSLLIGLMGLLLAIMFGSFIGSSDYRPVLFGAAVIVGFLLWFGTGEWFWPITIASSYLGGTFPILGGSFTPFQILMGIGVAKFLVEDVVMRRTSFVKVDRALLLSIIGFMGVMTLHGLHDRFGMRFLGSSVWGGRNYVNVYVGLVAFFVIQSVPVKSRLWNAFPYLVLAVTVFDLFVATFTTLLPASIRFIYPFYSAVGVAGVNDLVTGQEDLTGRIGTFGNFGSVLFALILAATPINRLFNFGHFVRLTGAGLAALMVVFSGYRSAVAAFSCTFLVAGYRDLRWGVLALLPVFAALLFGLSTFNSIVHPLPKQMQRALVFLPGDWDVDMARDARGSNDFREKVWTLWWREYFPAQPLFGRGFGFRSAFTESSIDTPASQDYQQMVEVGNIHNGLFAALDAVGIVGTVFFVLWNVLLLWKTLQVTFRTESEAGFVLRFLALQLAVTILTFWFGAVTMGTFLPGQFALAGVFLKLQRDSLSEKKIETGRTPSLPQGRQRIFAPV